MRSEANAPENGAPTVDFSYPTIPVAHRSIVDKDLLAKNNVTTLQPPPYSPDMTLANFYLFLRMEPTVRGRCFLILLTSLRMRRKS